LYEDRSKAAYGGLRFLGCAGGFFGRTCDLFKRSSKFFSGGRSLGYTSR
jgi:hypothetical protein